jgi:hypothetical protein
MQQFCVCTNHRPLIGALSCVYEPKSNRKRQQLSVIAKINANIRHIEIQDIVVADMLSRSAGDRGLKCCHSSFCHCCRQCRGPLIRSCRRRTSLLINISQIVAAQATCPDSKSTEQSSVFKKFLAAFHYLAHYGVRATRHLIASRYL